MWELLGEAVDGLDWVGRLLGAQGRVLPMSAVPLDITARVIGLDPAHPEAITEIRGQAEVATTEGHVVDVALDPADPPACPEALVAIAEADWVVVGPGLVVHLGDPELAGPGPVPRPASRRAPVAC